MTPFITKTRGHSESNRTMKNKKKCIWVILVFVVIILIIVFAYYFINKPKDNYTGLPNPETLPVPIVDWVTYTSDFGFSFMYPTVFKVETNDINIKVGGILVNVEKLNCENPNPSQKIESKTTLYGYRAEINEPEKLAYICNNTNTACLEIKKDENFQETKKTKITEGFFHSFISSLNLKENFDKISCIK